MMFGALALAIAVLAGFSGASPFPSLASFAGYAVAATISGGLLAVVDAIRIGGLEAKTEIVEAIRANPVATADAIRAAAKR
jgi:hypothetical protein